MTKMTRAFPTTEPGTLTWSNLPNKILDVFNKMSVDKAQSFLNSEVTSAIQYAKEHISSYDGEWVMWADAWLSGADRTSNSAISARRRAEGIAWRTVCGPAYAWEKVRAAEAAACADGGPYKRALGEASYLIQGGLYGQWRRICAFIGVG